MNKDEIIKEFLSNAGKKGGSVKSEAKAKAARENGKKGGRPRKGGNENADTNRN